MIRAALVDDAPLAGGGTGSTREIRKLIRQRRLRTVGLAVDAATAGGRQWLERAGRALSRGDYQVAAYAAATCREHEETTQASLVLARAATGLGHFEEAVVEAQRAVRLAPDEPEHHLTLAAVFEDLGNVRAALRSYQAAERLAPDSGPVRVGRALALAEAGDTPGAERLLESLYAAGRDRRLVGDCLGLVLVEAAEQVPQARIGERYIITTPGEIAMMRAKLTRAAEVAADPELSARIDEVRRYTDACARRKWLNVGLFRGSVGSMYLSVVGLLGVGAITLVGVGAWPPVLLVVALPPIGRVGYDLVLNYWVPRWRLNRQACER
jgi:Flp pilus assembly protein TadD